ncbi:inositol monophosphatase family protein [Catellatospora vulcania]|uniref:inositol monophosphatase family protein n=1 Tax=Catellatospora vulcania TaxID=1460450 RepID=UPI0012D4ADE5|nr:inositol monophosphatase family protein [Catellatospora vulcania]
MRRPRVTDDDLIEFAVELAANAGELSAGLFLAGSPRRFKEDGSEVTDADVRVEELVRAAVARYAPDDGLLGEETGESAGRSGRRWVCDPISGTAYFTRRMPLFANLIAYEDEHGPAVGVINLPMQQEMVVAAAGRGCRVLTGGQRRFGAGRRVEVDPADVGKPLLLAANQHTWSEELLVALHRRATVVGAVHHAAVHLVTGRVDGFVMTHQGYDDLAPLPVILAEAGATVTDLSGDPVLTGDGSALAASPTLHRHLLETTTAIRNGGAPYYRNP